MIKIIIIKQIVMQIKSKFKSKYSYSFSLPIILSNLKIEDIESSSRITQFSYGILLLRLIALFCFVNIIGYISAYYFIDINENSKFFNKYSRLSKFIIRYKKV